ncbi:MAG: hypothetical protein V1720_11285 [bacterium]
MKAIGGYFELELQDNKTVYHDNAIQVNSGRNALEYIFLSNNTYKKVYIPFYSCDAILQPIKRMNLEYSFYSLNRDFTPKIKKLHKKDVLIYINYFGILNKKTEGVIEKFGNVIIDNTQAFFTKPFENLLTFYSPRKFFGLPDGGFVYANKKISIDLERDNSFDRFDHLLKRCEDGPEAGFNGFQQNENKIENMPLRKMSTITERLLRNINFKTVLKKRNDNFLFLHKHLRFLNEFSSIIENEKINGPMVYPFLRKDNNKMKEYLIKNRIYVATYWRNVYGLTAEKSWEYYLTDNLIPLPIHQGINTDEIKHIVKIISEQLKNN